MGRVLGRIEYGDGQPPRYFIHCNTTGWSTQRLFATAQQAWKCYDQGGLDALNACRAPAVCTAVYGVRIVIADGREFACEPPSCDTATYGLATLDALLVPLSVEQMSHCLLLEADGVLHVAALVGGFFSGDYDQPLCKDRWTPEENEQRMALESYFGQGAHLCGVCLKTLLKTAPSRSTPCAE